MVLAEKPRITDIPKETTNGRFVPTFLGMSHTPDSIGKIKQALTDRPKSREQVRGMSTVWEVVRPLLIRGALPIEIAQISGFTHKQVRNAIYRKRPDEYSVPDALFTKEKETERRRKAAAPGKKKKLSERVETEDDKNRRRFARDILRRHAVLPGLAWFRKLAELYREKQRSLPESFFDRLRLEVFLFAIEQARLGEFIYLDIYKDIGRRIGENWAFSNLAQEEMLIIRATYNGLPYEEDEKGLYREDERRNRWRRMSVDPDGKTIFDNSENARLRSLRREVG